MRWYLLKMDDLVNSWRQWLALKETEPQIANESLQKIVEQVTWWFRTPGLQHDPLRLLCSEENLRRQLTDEGTHDPFAYALYKSSVWALAQARRKYTDAFRWCSSGAYAPIAMDAWDQLEEVSLPRLNAAISLDPGFISAQQALKEAEDLRNQCKQAARENWRTLKCCWEKEHAVLWADGIAVDHGLTLKSINRDSDDDILGTSRIYENEKFVLTIECGTSSIYYSGAVSFSAEVVRKSDGVISHMPYRRKRRRKVHRQIWRENVQSFADDVNEMFNYYRHYVENPPGGKHEGVIHIWRRTYGFISAPWGEKVFIHKSQIHGQRAKSAPYGLRVRFTFEYDFEGPRAVDVEVIGHVAEYTDRDIQRELRALRELSSQPEVETGNGGKKIV